MNQEILFEIQKARNGVSRPQLIDGTFNSFLVGGVQWLNACEFGSKRSCDSAMRATNIYKIPALFLIGGLRGLMEYIHHPKELQKFTTEINKAPNVAVILKEEEVPYYKDILPKLNYTLFYSEDHFIDHIT